MSEKFPKFGEGWEARLEERLTKSEEEHRGTPLPDFSSAESLFHRMQDVRYTQYMLDFCLRHPIMYMLFYRWWFIRSAPKVMRKYIPKLVCAQRKQCGWWDKFALYHPVLFLLWLTFYAVFQVCVKALSAPVKVIRSMKM